MLRPPAALASHWGLRDNLTAYDAAYVALAEATGTPLLTLDRRIANAHGHHAEVIVLQSVDPTFRSLLETLETEFFAERLVAISGHALPLQIAERIGKRNIDSELGKNR